MGKNPIALKRSAPRHFLPVAPMNPSRLPLTPLLYCATLVTLLASCAAMQKSKSTGRGAASNVENPADGSVLKLAQVESLQAEVSPAKPSEATVVIHGLLHDGATRVHDVQQQRLADGFVLTVVTTRPRNALASLALIPFERRISLNLHGMPKGPCKIVANGVATTIMVP
jgi:hypothetical protein